MKGQICTTCMRKRTLSHFDDKRFHVDGYTTMAYYHPDNDVRYGNMEVDAPAEEEVGVGI